MYKKITIKALALLSLYCYQNAHAMLTRPMQTIATKSLLGRINRPNGITRPTINANQLAQTVQTRDMSMLVASIVGGGQRASLAARNAMSSAAGGIFDAAVIAPYVFNKQSIATLSQKLSMIELIKYQMAIKPRIIGEILGLTKCAWLLQEFSQFITGKSLPLTDDKLLACIEDILNSIPQDEYSIKKVMQALPAAWNLCKQSELIQQFMAKHARTALVALCYSDSDTCIEMVTTILDQVKINPDEILQCEPRVAWKLFGAHDGKTGVPASAVQWAVRWNSPKMAELLLKYGSDWRKKDSFGKNALRYAEDHDNLEIFKLLMQYGFKLPKSTDGIPVVTLNRNAHKIQAFIDETLGQEPHKAFEI